MKRLAALSFFLFLASMPCASPAQEAAPPGWRFPGEQDYLGDWAAYRKVIPVPFRARADFNGDGAADDAWMLIRPDMPGWGLFVFTGVRAGAPERVLQLAEGKAGQAQSRGVRVASPGRYKITDESGKRTDLVLAYPGIILYEFQGRSLLFYWDASLGMFRNARL